VNYRSGARVEYAVEQYAFDRLVEQEAIYGAAAYRPADFLADVRKGIWRESNVGPVRIDAYRRNLQDSYLDLLGQK